MRQLASYTEVQGLTGNNIDLTSQSSSERRDHQTYNGCSIIYNSELVATLLKY